MSKITVYPGELVFHVNKGIPFREFLMHEGLLMDFPCGGEGRCGQCKIIINPLTESGKGGKKPLPDDELSEGIRLACQAVVEGDCTVTIPEGKGQGIGWKNTEGGETPHLLYGDPRIIRKKISLTAPSLEDQRADWERLKDALNQTACTTSVETHRLEHFSGILRENNWEADAILENGNLLCLHPKSDERIYGFAIDLGTTTVDISLHDMETGRRIGRETLLNRQTAYGADVISRANHFKDNRKQVRQSALETIQEGAESILKEQKIPSNRVVRSVVVGNPIMLHILHDFDPMQLTLSPYIPLISGMVRRPPQDFFWNFQQFGYVETLPLISAFVGADTMGMILALDLEHETEVSLSIDIGTNGEIVLATEGRMITTSTAAGPAFEGAQISCGMRALAGAITSVSISKNGELDLKVIGDIGDIENIKPRGFCGSGLISCIAELLNSGILDSSGRLNEPDEIDEAFRKRIIKVDDKPAFSVTPANDVYITQKDIREFQLAKGAIRTGIDMLLSETNVSPVELKKISLAGNFGAGIDVSKAMRLGLIPQVPLDIVDAVGNAALRGASLALVAKGYSERADRLHRECGFLELAGKPNFHMRFAEAMFF